MSDSFTAATDLLLGEHPSPDQVIRAGELFEQASAEGHAEASERLALLEALGVLRPQNWERALDLLELAARQGSQRAREQLLLLADNRQHPSVPEDAVDNFWRSARKRVDLAARTVPGETIPLLESPRVRLIKQFATGAECRWLIGLARERMARATVFDQVSGAQIHVDSRDNSFFGMPLSELNVLTEVIRNRISSAIRLPVPLFEASQILHYSVGQQFKSHYDFLDPENPAYREDLARHGQRIATFLIYLNGGYGGGETSFPKIGRTFRAEEGDALFFANVARDGSPDPLTLHAGLPPTSGEKWVFSQWIRDQFPKE